MARACRNLSKSDEKYERIFGNTRVLRFAEGIVAGWIVILLLAWCFEAPDVVSFGFFNVVIVAAIISAFRPRIWREGDDLVFAPYLFANGQIRRKLDGAEVARVIEWDGFEGTLYDICRKDGEIWTIDLVRGASLKTVVASLRRCGFRKFPVERKLRIFRPQYVDLE